MYSPITFIVFIVLIGIGGWNTWDMYHKSRKTEDALAKTQEAYANLENREEFLNDKIKTLSTPAGIESEIRERFGVAKADEEVIVVLSDEEEGSLVTDEAGFWERFKNWFSWGDGDYVKER